MKSIDNETVCSLVQDLLPLYHDGVCNDESRAFIEEHLESCGGCSDMLKSLDSDIAEERFTADAREVLKRHAKKEKNAAVITGSIIAGILMIPVVIALILTLPGYSDLKTDAVLIASMLLVAGMTVVPLVSKTKRFSKTVIFSTLALLMIIFFTEMFFDDGGWLRFGEIAFSVIFGLSVIFSPFIIMQTDLPKTLKNHKGLLTMSWDTIWFYLMIFIFAIAYPNSTRELLSVSTFFVALAWLIFFTARYIKVNGFIRAGIITALLGIWISIGNGMGWITIAELDLHMKIFAVSLIIAVVLCAVGIILTLAKKNR